MYKRLVLIGTILTVALGVAVFPRNYQAAAQDTPSNPTLPLTISVTGLGTAYSAPDIAYVSVGVDISNADIATAMNDANARMEAITAALTELGIAATDIRTENFSIYRENFYGPEGPTGEGTFRVSNYLRVTVRDTSKVSDVLQTSIDAGANAVGGVMFDIADRGAVESEARADAVENARAKAEELASLMGVSVGNVISISDSVNSAMPFYGNYGGGGGAMMDTASAPPVEAGSLAVSVSISVTFELVR